MEGVKLAPPPEKTTLKKPSLIRVNQCNLVMVYIKDCSETPFS